MTMQQFTQLLFALAPYLVPILAAVLFPIVKSFLDKLPAPARARIAEIVTTAVNATEQVMAPDASPQQKKSEAIRRIEAGLAQAHLSVPASVYDSLIEEAVLMLNVLEGKNVGGPSAPASIVDPPPFDQDKTVHMPAVRAVGDSRQGAE